nr:30-kDa cleavage and polyadenylation specificity factor 30-like [Ipomoea batatas]
MPASPLQYLTYKLGFCPNGPDCRYRHTRVPGPPPPVEEVLQKIQQLASHNFGYSNRFFQNRNANFAPQVEKTQIGLGPNVVNQATKATMKGSPISQQQHQQQVQQPQQGSQAPNLLNAPQNQANRSAIPLPQGTSRYFVVKSRNRENLELSAQQGVWATQRSNEAKLNEAFDSVENVFLIFSVNGTKHFQGCAKMTTGIGGTANGGNWKHEHGTAHYGRNFSVKWLKLCELSFQKASHLRNPYMKNLPVKISRDCQELEASVGQQLASLLYLEPDSELMVCNVFNCPS